MLTPQEVQEKKFKQAFVGGYDMTAVDDFLEALTEDYTNLFKENAVLKNKMKVLVEKLEEYRSNEGSIRQAYVAIRTQAEKELAEAQAEKARIMGQAKQETEGYITDIRADIAKEEKRLSVTRGQTASFISALKDCYNKQIEQLDIILSASMEDSPRKKHDDMVQNAANEINASLASIEELAASARAMDAAAAPEAPADAAAQTELPPLTLEAPPEQLPQPSPESEPPDIDISFWEERSTLQEDAPPAPISAPKEPDEDLVYSVEHSMTTTFNSGEEVDWTPDEISEVRRPTFDFSSLPGHFGHRSEPKGSKRRGRANRE
jgi:cell division initiation protein